MALEALYAALTNDLQMQSYYGKKRIMKNNIEDTWKGGIADDTNVERELVYLIVWSLDVKVYLLM